jgi:hypothetical protein
MSASRLMSGNTEDDAHSDIGPSMLEFNYLDMEDVNNLVNLEAEEDDDDDSTE